MTCPYCRRPLPDSARVHVIVCHLLAAQGRNENKAISEALK